MTADAEENHASIDAELVKRVQAGEKAAFDLLVRKYQSRVISLVNRYVKSQVTAQDISQEAFIKAYRGLKNFRGDSAFYTWLYRIAINTAKNHLVAQSRRVPDFEIDAQEAELYGTSELLQDQHSPEKALLTEEIKREIFAAIEKLPEDLKTAITLRELEGLSYEEIAEAMDCPIGTVRSRIFRAREAVDKVLQPLLN